MPPALPAMWRALKLGYRHEPRLLVVAFALSQLAALPDALLALWLKVLGDGVMQKDAARVVGAALGLGAGLVLLDEPTAQLDVRGEAEIFDRLLAATRHATTILISHRFSTVRMADEIAVIEDGTVIEQGSHEDLMRKGGRYAHLFTLQALGYR